MFSRFVFLFVFFFQTDPWITKSKIGHVFIFFRLLPDPFFLPRLDDPSEALNLIWDSLANFRKKPLSFILINRQWREYWLHKWLYTWESYAIFSSLFIWKINERLDMMISTIVQEITTKPLTRTKKKSKNPVTLH